MKRLIPFISIVGLTLHCADESPAPAVGPGTTATPPNILLIIADDLGLDASAQFDLSQDLPSTPNLDALAANGIVFENAWATPACTTTRGTIISGQHGVHSGVSFVPAVLPADTQSLQAYLKADDASSVYQSAIVGKWHLGGADPDANHPATFGVEYYAGNLAGTLDDYSQWSLTTNGVAEESTQYHTSQVTDLASAWVGQQTNPWFMWLAYVAPHSPLHVPPGGLHNRNLSGTEQDMQDNGREYYLAAIEAMDTEIGRLLEELTPEVRDNTIVIFLGDNGTPRPFIDSTVFPTAHGKNSLYEGGVRVPMIISGKGVSRIAEREAALVNSTDIFATVAELTGAAFTATTDSQSFAGLLSNPNAAAREFNYVEFESTNVTGWAVRDSRYKLITFDDGTQELYDLSIDLAESNNLLAGGADQSTIVDPLVAFAETIRASKPPVLPGTVDITDILFTSRSPSCADYITHSISSVLDVTRNQNFEGDLKISLVGDKCVFETNGIPNHDFNDAMGFPNDVSEQSDTKEVPALPEFAAAPTALTLVTDNALLLNGVKVDLLAAGCFGVGNGKIGCNDINQPWRYDPMFAANGFRVDSHNAHTQPNGSYHYHGPPNALFPSTATVPSGVVGFAADGFPIFGSFFDDAGALRKALPSYQLKANPRPSTNGAPGGDYDGAYRDDYEYVQGTGDLDECNGMTVDGAYGYYITDGFPYILGCYKGTPDSSFNKR